MSKKIKSQNSELNYEYPYYMVDSYTSSLQDKEHYGVSQLCGDLKVSHLLTVKMKIPWGRKK